MATRTAASPPRRKVSLAPDNFDRLLSAAALILLLMVSVAMFRGRSEWSGIPAFVWLHLFTIVLALGLTPVMLLRRRGDRLHRRLGWVWCGAMALTAASTFGIRGINDGGLSLIHILSAITLAGVPLVIWSARTHRVATHRWQVRSLVAGALVVAGGFTFLPDRALGQWLFG
jgi:uncharacterized membrane protein